MSVSITYDFGMVSSYTIHCVCVMCIQYYWNLISFSIQSLNSERIHLKLDFHFTFAIWFFLWISFGVLMLDALCFHLNSAIFLSLCMIIAQLDSLYLRLYCKWVGIHSMDFGTIYRIFRWKTMLLFSMRPESAFALKSIHCHGSDNALRMELYLIAINLWYVAHSRPKPQKQFNNSQQIHQFGEHVLCCGDHNIMSINLTCQTDQKKSISFGEMETMLRIKAHTAYTLHFIR